MAHRVLVLLAETPVHAGGSEAAGIVDLPIQREAVSRLPVIWGQSLKGALRDNLRRLLTENELTRIFGERLPTPDANTEDGAQGIAELSKGAVAVGDAQLLLFPAASLVHCFAWVTAPMLLARLRRRLAMCGVPDSTALTLATAPGKMVLAGAGWSGLQVLGPFVQTVRDGDTSLPVVAGSLARMVFPANPVFDTAREKLRADLVAVDDGVLGELSETGTEIAARVRLNENKTAQDGGLFYAEYLPAESVLLTVLTGPEDDLRTLTEKLDGTVIQVGGNETIGKGVLWCRVHDTTSLTALLADTPAAVSRPGPVVDEGTVPDRGATPARPSGSDPGRPSPGMMKKRAPR